MNEADFLYYYSKYFLSTFTKIVIVKENWTLRDTDRYYKDIIISIDALYNKVLEYPNQEEKVIKDCANGLLMDAKKEFIKTFSNCLKNDNRNISDKKNELIADIKVNLLPRENLTMIDFVKLVREKEIEYLTRS